MLELPAGRVKTQRIKQQLLFALTAEDKHIAQLGHILRVKCIQRISALIPDKAFTHARHTALIVDHMLGHRENLVARIGVELGLQHRKGG